MNLKENLKKLNLRNFILLTIAGIINAFGVTMFLAPVKLYDSGISGTSMLLAQITPEWLTLLIFLIILNFPLFLSGLKRRESALRFIPFMQSVSIHSVHG